MTYEGLAIEVAKRMPKGFSYMLLHEHRTYVGEKFKELSFQRTEVWSISDNSFSYHWGVSAKDFFVMAESPEKLIEELEIYLITRTFQ
jgi:hypothetical protein